MPPSSSLLTTRAPQKKIIMNPPKHELTVYRGEQTASMLEANLTSLESKLDAILAGLESQIPAAETQEPKKEPKQEEPKS